MARRIVATILFTLILCTWFLASLTHGADKAEAEIRPYPPMLLYRVGSDNQLRLTIYIPRHKDNHCYAVAWSQTPGEAGSFTREIGEDDPQANVRYLRRLVPGTLHITVYLHRIITTEDGFKNREYRFTKTVEVH